MSSLGQTLVIVMVVATAITAIVPPGATGLRRAMAAMPVVAAGAGWAAVAVLALALLTNRWELAYVTATSRAGAPWPLRLASVWGGAEGSLLLFTAMMATALALTTVLGGRTAAARILAAAAAGYGLIVATVADPFVRLPDPSGTGRGLEPILEHPAMVWHPPVLYAGLVGLLVPCTLLLGSATGGDRLIPLTLALLGLGLASGANWAYGELGWGGYWAWDPVENAGLVAWLAGAIVLHERGPPVAGPVATAAAAVSAAAVVWATTITRTGVIESVHAFADRGALRPALAATAVAYTVAVVACAAVTSSTTARAAEPGRRVRSRGAAWVLAAALVIVASGTYQPAVVAATGGADFVTDGRFYTVLLWPVAVIGSTARVVTSVRRGATVIWPAAGAVAAMATIMAGPGSIDVWALGLAAAGGGAAGSTVGGDQRVSDRLVHAGMGLLLVGIAATTASWSATVVAVADQPVTVGSPDRTGLTVTHRGVEVIDDGTTSRVVARLEVDERGLFQPSLVSFQRSGRSTAETDTDRSLTADLQVVLIDAGADRASYRLLVQPGMTLVWSSVAVLLVGLLITAWVPARPTANPATRRRQGGCG